MGCQCNKQNEEEQEDELKKDSLDGMNDVFKEDNNFNNKEEVFGLNNQEENHEEQKENDPKLKGSNNKNQPDEDYNERLAEEKNAKYGNYPEKMLDIINRIREDPASYADYIEDSIKNIVEEIDKKDETKTKLIYKKKVKVALTRGEIAFREAAEKLRNMEPVPPLELNENIIIPLPETEEENNKKHKENDAK